MAEVWRDSATAWDSVPCRTSDAEQAASALTALLPTCTLEMFGGLPDVRSMPREG